MRRVNFRGQSGRRVPSRPVLRQGPVTCVCRHNHINDYTGAPYVSFSECQGVATAGVMDCSCCKSGAIAPTGV